MSVSIPKCPGCSGPQDTLPFVLSSLGIRLTPPNPTSSSQPSPSRQHSRTYTVHAFTSQDLGLGPENHEEEQTSPSPFPPLPQLSPPEIARLYTRLFPGPKSFYPWNKIKSLLKSKFNDRKEAEKNGLGKLDIEQWIMMRTYAKSEQARVDGAGKEQGLSEEEKDSKRRALFEDALIWGLAVDQCEGLEGIADVVKELVVERLSLVYCGMFFGLTVGGRMRA